MISDDFGCAKNHEIQAFKKISISIPKSRKILIQNQKIKNRFPTNTPFSVTVGVLQTNFDEIFHHLGFPAGTFFSIFTKNQ